MKRSSIITISILILALPFGCAKKDPSTSATATHAADADDRAKKQKKCRRLWDYNLRERLVYERERNR